MVRDMRGVITYWNRGAEAMYGWTTEEVLGQISHLLLQTVFPQPLEHIQAELVSSGRWEGELSHSCRDGEQIVVASRWALQRDGQGKPVATLGSTAISPRASGRRRRCTRRRRNSRISHG
jgi:PAS domain S-box-containing protein